MKRAMVLALVALTAACGVRPTGVVGAGDPPVADAPNTTHLVYFVKDGKLEPVVRVSLPREPWNVIRHLGAGPTRAEQKRGLTGKTKEILGVTLDPDEVTTVVVTMDIGTPPINWSRLTKAQIACTAAAIPGIKAVSLNGTVEEAKMIKVGCDEFRGLMAR